jgi:phosphatidylinositol-4-phosphate 3-kinase
MMQQWHPLKPVDALALLSTKYPDQRIRQYAANRLDSLSNEEFLDFLPQLVQVVRLQLLLNVRLSKTRITITTLWWHFL